SRTAEAKALVEKARAEAAGANAARLQAEAEADKRRAQEESARRVRLVSLMSAMMKDIGLQISLGADRTNFRDILDQAAILKKELADQPEIEAGVDETLGGAYFKMGDHKQAEELFLDALTLRRRSQGENAPPVAHTLNYLGLVYSGESRWFEAETSFRQALELQERNFGPQHAEVAKTLSTLGWALAQQAKHQEAEHY